MWTLIIIASSNNYSNPAHVAIEHIKFGSEQLCKAARDEMVKNHFNNARVDISTACVRTGCE